MNKKIYILKKDCPNIYKEEGDYYNNEYAESIEELLKKGIIEEEILNNMELKKQVLSLELAKRLKELGVEQNSLFYWINIVSKDIYPVYKVEYYNEYTSNFKIDDVYSAFTVAELGEMLPSIEYYQTFNGEKTEYDSNGIRIDCYKKFINNKDVYCCEIIGDEFYKITSNDSYPKNGFYSDKEVDARAKIIIYLLENKLI